MNLADGLRQVAEGDFEGAVVTLAAVAERLSADGGPAADLARAHLYLGIAHIALDARDEAKTAFREALRHEPSLRLTLDRFSPKVVGAFDEARTEATAMKPSKAGRGGRTLALVGAGGAAVAAGVLVAGGGSAEDGEPSFFAARFATPVLVCPAESFDVPLPLAIELEGSNPAQREVEVAVVSAVLIIVASPLAAWEVGFASNRSATLTPARLPARGRATLRLETTLLCNNAGGMPRYNEWRGRVTLNTPGGVHTLETADTLRVNIF
jgi:hypothetical protein